MAAGRPFKGGLHSKASHGPSRHTECRSVSYATSSRGRAARRGSARRPRCTEPRCQHKMNSRRIARARACTPLRARGALLARQTGRADAARRIDAGTSSNAPPAGRRHGSSGGQKGAERVRGRGCTGRSRRTLSAGFSVAPSLALRLASHPKWGARMYVPGGLDSLFLLTPWAF